MHAFCHMCVNNLLNQPEDIQMNGYRHTDSRTSMNSKDLHSESANSVVKNNTLTWCVSKFCLQIKRIAISTIFATTYLNLTMRYHEIKVYSIIQQSYSLTSKHFKNSWFSFLGYCQILVKVNLIRPDNLLSELNQINIFW